MSFTVFQIISLAVVLVGVLIILESFIIVGGKGVDINGELPFMAFGTLFAAGMPVALQLLGAWGKSWYWYIFIGFLMMSGFTAYIRSRGYTIRLFKASMKSAITGVDFALKQNKITYQKESKELKEGTVTKYTIGDGKYPIFVTDKKRDALIEAHIEIVAPEALWNKDLQYQLKFLVDHSRKDRTATETLKSVLPRILFAMTLIFLGMYLFGMGA